jgi:hypothetical protein
MNGIDDRRGDAPSIPSIRLIPLIPFLLAACELTEVTVPPGESRVVVQAILSRGALSQFVIVEESATGSGVTDYGGETIPPDGPDRPIGGATVILSSGAGDVCGPATDTLSPLADAAGVYGATGLCTPAPGDVVRLRVELPDGRVVTGGTTIPGARALVAEIAGQARAPSSFIVFNRDRDSIHLAAEAIVARGMQVEVRRADVRPSELEFYFLLDSLRFRLAGDFIEAYEGDEPLFRAGVEYDLTFAVADTNFYDFARSFSDPLTGRGFLNHLEGGIGVFGSVEPYHYQLHVVADVDDPREGEYRLQGVVAGEPVDLSIELYRDPLQPSRFAAFVNGRWYGGPVNQSLYGFFGPVGGQTENDFVASFRVLREPDTTSINWRLQGRRVRQGFPFPVEVMGFGPADDRPVVDSVTAIQVSGPALTGSRPAVALTQQAIGRRESPARPPRVNALPHHGMAPAQEAPVRRVWVNLSRMRACCGQTF